MPCLRSSRPRRRQIDVCRAGAIEQLRRSRQRRDWSMQAKNIRLIKSRLDVAPALLLQLHYTHNAGLHDRRLGDNGNLLVLDLVHIFLGIAAGLEGDFWRALLDRLDPRLDRRGVVAQHMQAGTVSDDLDRYFLAEIL